MTQFRILPALAGLLLGAAANAFASPLPFPSTPPSPAFGWGSNYSGTLGNANTADTSPTPVQADGVKDAVAISASPAHVLALKSDGTVWAWGENFGGELGNDTNAATSDPNPAPTQVEGLSDIVAVSAGHHFSLALKSDGTVWTWGWNVYGQLGNSTNLGATTPNPTPTQVEGLSEVVTISAGYHHSLALKSDGTVWAWGWNVYGQLGTSTNLGTYNYLPTQVSDLDGITAISGGFVHSLALKNDGTVWAWGYNYRGELGSTADNGTDTPHPVPMQIADFDGVTAIAAGAYHSAALKNDGSVWTWGANPSGQLGNNLDLGNFHAHPTPTQVTNLSGVVTISASTDNTMVLKDDGTVWAWGGNVEGQVDNKTASPEVYVYSTPTQVPEVKSVVALTGGTDFGIILTDGVPEAQDSTNIVTSVTASKRVKMMATDPQGDALTYTIITPPSHGSLSDQSGAIVTYTPDATFSSSDSFIFKVNDGIYDSNIATVTFQLNQAPTLTSLVPAKLDNSVSGSGGVSAVGEPLKLVLQIDDPNGADQLRVAYLTFNGTLNNANGLALSYDFAANKLYLRSSDGKILLGGVAPSSVGTVENDFGTLDFADSTVVKKGTVATITFVVTPKTPFIGVKKLWAAVRDSAGAQADFTQMATWTVNQAQSVGVVANDAIKLIKSGDASLRFTLPVTNPNGLLLSYTLITQPAHGTAAVDAGGTVTFIPDGTFNAAGTDSFTYKVNDGYADSNTATITIKYNSAPTLVTLEPGTADGSVIGSGNSSAAGEPLKLVLTVSDEDGADKLRAAYVTFNRVLSNGNGIVVSYDLAGNKLYLRSSDGKTTLGGQAPGSAGTVENDFGILDFSQSTIVKSGSNLTVTFYITPKTSFTGTMKLWGAVRDTGNLQTGYDQMATWTVNPAAFAALSVKPAANKPSANGS